MTNKDFLKFALLFYLPIYLLVILATYTEINWIILIGLLILISIAFYNLKNKGYVKEPHSPKPQLMGGLFLIYLIARNFLNIDGFIVITIFLAVSIVILYYSKVVLKIRKPENNSRL